MLVTIKAPILLYSRFQVYLGFNFKRFIWGFKNLKALQEVYKVYVGFKRFI